MRKSVYSVLHGLALILCASFFIACSFGAIPAWQSRTSVKVSVGAASGSGGRAVASGSGYLYVQTEIASGEAVVYGPYTATDSVYTIADIPAGTHKPFILVYTQALPSVGLSVLSPADSSASGYLAALQGLWKDDPAVLAGSSFGYLDSVTVLAETDTVVQATLVPTTDIVIAGSGLVSIAGIAGQSVRRFVKISGLKAAFSGADASSATMTCTALNPSADPMTVSAVGLYDSAGAKLSFNSAESLVAAKGSLSFASAWSGDDEYYLYVEFTGSGLQLAFTGGSPAPSAVTHTVTYDPNGGTGTMASQTIAEGAMATLTKNAFTRSGYYFVGWGLTADATTVWYSDGAPYVMGKADMTLYAIWSSSAHTITFDANGGTGTMASQTIADGGSANLTANQYTRTGYSFNGWGTIPSQTTGTYTDGGFYTMGTSDVTLYAIWVINSYTVTFNANGGTGTMAPLTVIYGVSTTLTANSFTRDGCTFSGWATSASATGADYADCATYSTGLANATLYAVWKDTAAPTVSSLTFGAAYTLLPSANLTCTAVENGSGIKTITLSGDVASSLSGATVSVSGTTLGSSVSGTTITLTTATTVSGPLVISGIPLDATVDGLKSVSVSMMDATGNVSSPVAASISLDTISPVITITTAPAIGRAGTAFTIIGTVADANGIASVAVSLNGTPMAALVTGNDFSCTYTPMSLPDGTYPLSATATDNAGRTTTVSRPILIDCTPPALTISSVASNNATSTAYARTGDVVTVAGTASDASSGIASVTMSFNAGIPVAMAGPANFCGTYTVSGSESDGPLAVAITAADSAGNIATMNNTTIMIDNTLPNIDSVTINGTVYTSGGHLTLMTGSSCTIAVSCTDSGSGVSGVSLDGSSYSPNGTPLNFDVVDGDTMLIIYARDNAGNVMGPGGFQVTITGSASGT
jgi:uncharacterized repeat protein (TIGR02543 family)